MASHIALLLVLTILVTLAHSQQCVPATPTADTTINPASYNGLLSSFSSNGPNNNAPNDTSLLNLYVQWNATNNRNIKWIGIGSGTECTADIYHPDTNAYGTWAISAPDTDCVVNATASYIWPQTFYDLSCAPQFSITVDNTDNTETLTFLIFVQYEDCSNVSRNNVNITVCNNITTQLPVSIVFPLATSVSTSLPVGVFSASSVNITAALASQTLTLNNPALAPTATFTFVTFVGESFQLDPNNGITGPVDGISISLSDNTVTFPTRRQLWSVTVPVDSGACKIDGVYTTNFTIYFTAQNGSGTLPPDQNPIPNNSTATVSFTIVSADFCAIFSNPTIVAVVEPYFLNITNYFGGASTVPPQRGFLTGDFMYLAAHVTSGFLPILTTKIVKVYTSTGSNPTFVELPSTNPLLSYGTAQGGVDNMAGVTYPRSDAVSWFVVDPTIFPVAGDQNVQYNFQVDILVTYNNNGQKKRALVSTRGAIPTSQTTSASTFALIASGTTSFAFSLQSNVLAVCAAVLTAYLIV